MISAVLAPASSPTGNAVELPTDWQTARLDSVADLLSGGTPSKSRPEWWAGPIPWASPKDMKRLHLIDVEDHISEDALRHGSRLVPAKTVFVVIRGMVLTKDLPVAMAEIPMAFNQDMKAVVARNEVDPDYLLYALASRKHALSREIGTSAHGTRRIGSSSLEALMLALPPKREQITIATVLRKLEAAVETQGRIVATLKELKATTMTKLFREGLRGGAAGSVQTRFGEAPGNWRVAPLVEHAEVQTGVAKGRDLGDSDTIEIPYLRVANVQDGYLDLSEIKTIRIRARERDRYALRAGDVLLTEGGDFDKLGRGYLWDGTIEQCVHQNHIFAVRTDGKTLLPEFFAYLVQSPYGKAYFLSVAHKTTNLACINATKLKAFPILLPDLTEQGEIVAALRGIDAVLDAHTRRLGAVKAMFSTMLTSLMTGQLRLGEGSRPGDEREVAAGEVEGLLGELVRRFEPEQVILFGDPVPGSPKAEGGIGLLVVMPFQGRALAETVRIQRELQPDREIDLLVRRPAEVRQALRTGDALITGIVERGRVLHVHPGTEGSLTEGEDEAPLRADRHGRPDEATLREVVHRIVKTVAPEKIILFGSAARGEMGPDSDLDLLVVKAGDRRGAARTIYEALCGVSPWLPKDVVVVTPEDVERHRDTIGYVIRPALREGRVLYAA